MKKYIFLFLLYCVFFSPDYSFPQLTKAIIGVDGFTCSLCAKGVEEQFKTLDFVKSVKADIKKTEFTISFKTKPAINVKELNSAVTDGGFTIRDIKVKAIGIIKGNSVSGYWLSASNIPDLKLKDLKGNFSEGDKISLEGAVDPVDVSLYVISIKKL
ncbi:MAG: heavy-metal-associated domain-containing protein [Bacteroidetes bacterium]|nr:heavy-metal-associated domain-containing protein [Bacteroidota bacterium]